MKVWVVEQGAYEDRDIVGVYSSAELAIKAHPIPPDYVYPEKPSASNCSRPGGWQQNQSGNWNNGLDWGAGKTITAYEVDG